MDAIFRPHIHRPAAAADKLHSDTDRTRERAERRERAREREREIARERARDREIDINSE